MRGLSHGIILINLLSLPHLGKVAQWVGITFSIKFSIDSGLNPTDVLGRALGPNLVTRLQVAFGETAL